MKVFQKPNTSFGWKCKICNSNEEKETVLVPIVGTEEDGIIQAEQFHKECLNLMYDQKFNIIYQKLGV